jgi:hypothetical protein
VKFDLSKRATEFGGFNNRWEKNGPEQKTKAIDLPFRVQVKPKELDMIVPAQGVKLSTFLFGSDLRKPQLQCPLLSPLPVQRKPEHIALTIYDDGVDKRKKLTFTDCKVKDPTLEFEDATIFLSGKFQLHPGPHLQRINDNVENKTLQMECEATQPELFDEQQDEDDEGGESDSQTDIDDEEEGEEEDDQDD